MKTTFEYQYTYRGHAGDQKINETITLAEMKKLVRAINSPDFSHARFREFCGGTVIIYHRNQGSPSGVLSAGGGRLELVDPLLRHYRNTSPLSPTER